MVISQFIRQPADGEKSSNINTPLVRQPGGFGVYIKQAIQGLFTAGTSPERKRSVANGD
jgi:hypothetical protein